MSVGRGEESADKGAGLQLDGLSGPHSTCLCFGGGEVLCTIRHWFSLLFFSLISS